MYLHQGGRFDGCLPPPHVEVLWHAAGANVVGWVVRSFLGDGVEKDFGELQEFSGVLGRHRRHGGLRRHLHPGVHASMQRLTSGKRRDGVRHRKKVSSLHLKQPVGEAAAHQNEDRVWAQAVGGNALAVGEFDEQARIRKRGDEQEDPIVDVERNQELVLWSGFSGDLEDANFRIIRIYFFGFECRPLYKQHLVLSDNYARNFILYENFGSAWRDSNPGRLGEKRERYLCAMPSPM